jgi:hypothetical protein
LRREAPKSKPREEIKYITPPPEIIYEKPPPPRIEYIPEPAISLCPVFVPNHFQSLPNEGIQRLDILANPEIPIGFQDLRFADLTSEKPANNRLDPLATEHMISPGYAPFNYQNAPVSINQQQLGMQRTNVFSDFAVGGWMPVVASL